ncbi:hypothetical protein E1265_18415 [Streptomyces sp. 8K308]|nr:hypothetical protein E1265_18415 [Streptomyces sp. 8K308]
MLAVLTAFLPAGARAAGPALAGTAGFCPDSSGVTVVVDFRELGGGRVVRCAPGGQSDGLAALRNAGFEVSGTSRWGDAFVCRINNRPGADRESCVDTPPASAYWSYWHADNGGQWTYSQLGATYRTPREGSFEGWSFSLDRETGDAPAPGVAPVRPAEDDEQGGGGSSSGGGSSGDSGSSAGGGSAAGGDSGGTDGGSASGGTGGQDGGSASSGGQSEPDAAGAGADPGDDATPPSEDRDDQGSDQEESTERPAAEDEETAETTPGPTPSEAADWSGQDEEFEEERAASESSGPSASTVATLGLLAALVAAGGLAAWRRRRAARTAGEK